MFTLIELETLCSVGLDEELVSDIRVGPPVFKGSGAETFSRFES